ASATDSRPFHADASLVKEAPPEEAGIVLAPGSFHPAPWPCARPNHHQGALMRVRSLAAAALVLAAVPALAVRSHAAPPAESWKIDSVHSNAIFRVKHMNVSYFWGRFNDVSGTITTGDKPSIDVAIKVESIDSNNAG